MQIDTIKLFCDVAQLRSFSRGAELHDVTQSAASQRIQALEKELGVQLIDRSKRPLELTAAGELYLSGCKQIVERYQRLTRQVTGLAGPDAPEHRGEVVITAIYSAGIELLNQIKTDFETEHPRASITIHYLQPQAVHDHVLHEQADLGILSFPDQWRDLASIPLRNESMVLVGRPGHPVLESGHAHPEQLTNQPFVTFERTLPVGRRIARYLRQHHANPRSISEFDNADTIKTFLAQSPDALAILPHRIVRREEQSGQLVTATLDPQLIRPVGIVYVRQKEQGPLVRAFIEFLIRNQPAEPDAKSLVSAATA